MQSKGGTVESPPRELGYSTNRISLYIKFQSHPAAFPLWKREGAQIHSYQGRWHGLDNSANEATTLSRP
jgi:hypothetical protein